jgi:hypothetical protein
MGALSTWLQELGLERYASVFAENDVDLDALCRLADAELEQPGVSPGHRKSCSGRSKGRAPVTRSRRRVVRIPTHRSISPKES